MEIQFESGSFPNRPNALIGSSYEQALQTHLQNFDEKFDSLFGLKSKGYQDDDIYFAKATLSNMLGGIGYFHGSSLVKSKFVYILHSNIYCRLTYLCGLLFSSLFMFRPVFCCRYTGEHPLDYWSTSLYTAVPSRSFFPRGFLWDEGFHNILISKWDVEISKDIIGRIYYTDLITINHNFHFMNT